MVAGEGFEPSKAEPGDLQSSGKADELCLRKTLGLVSCQSIFCFVLSSTSSSKLFLYLISL